MSICVYCIASNEGQAIRIANRLREVGVSTDDISVLAPGASGTHDLALENTTKAPEGVAAGAGTGAILGGAIGWLAGIGSLAIPGLGPLIAAGPILGTLSGMAVGGTVGGLTGALIGMGIPQYEAKMYEGKVRKGGILISVHAETSEEAARIRDLLVEEEAQDISTGTEAAVRG